MLRCKACAVQVPNCKERRSLESSTCDLVRSSLEVCFTSSGCCEAVARQHVSSGYVCKRCFVLVDKKVRLETEMEKVKTDLNQKVAGAIKSFALPEEAPSPAPDSLEVPKIPSAQKRPSGAADSEVSAPKRLRIDQPSSGQSPGVTVSLKRVLSEVNSNINEHNSLMCQPDFVPQSMAFPV